MTVVRVFLGGEGRNELGGRAGHPVYASEEPVVIETLLRRCQPDGWQVCDSTPWCQITKFAAKGRTPDDERNVLGLVLMAKRAQSHVVAFVRDADADKDRPNVIDAAIRKAEETFPGIDVIGGTAVPVLEAWVLAIRGERGTEEMSKGEAKRRLDEMGVADTAAMEAARGVVADKIPEDAKGLRHWLCKASDALPQRVNAARSMTAHEPA